MNPETTVLQDLLRRVRTRRQLLLSLRGVAISAGVVAALLLDRARAAQIVHGSRRGSRTIEHLGSAHDDEELEALKAAARQRLAGGQGQLDANGFRLPLGGGVVRRPA